MTRTKSTYLALVAVLLSAAISLPAAADIINLEATLDGAQANAGAGTGSPGSGTFDVSFDTTTNMVSWSNFTWVDLIGTPFIAHMHGAALPNQNAGVQVTVGLAMNGTHGFALTASQEADLLGGLWYINLHTDDFPGGEIRGQITVSEPIPVPEPATLFLMGFGLAGMGLTRRRHTA